jgi:hypothetical protein
MLCFVCVVSMGSHGHRLRIHRHPNNLGSFGMTEQITLACGRSALVDAEDFEAIKAYPWHAHSCRDRVYAITRQHGAAILMHRRILGAASGAIVDHINGNTLDNRRANLRFASNQQNSMNHRPRGAVPFSGVTRRGALYAAAIWPNGSQINLGTDHQSAEAAAAIYNAAASLFFKEFARLNPVPTDWDGLRSLSTRGLKGSDLLISALELRHGT